MATKKTAEAKNAASKKATAAKKATGRAAAKTEDVIFEGPLGQALAAARTPVYAYIGANDLAVEAVAHIVSDLRQRAEDTVMGLQERAAEVPGRVQAVPGEVASLLNQFRPEELRKVAEAYVQVAAGIYNGLAARGEDVVTRLREENPQLDAGLSRAEAAMHKADEQLAEGLEAGEEALGTVARQTRSLGVRGANKVADAAHETADMVEDAAFAASDEIQSAAAKIEARTLNDQPAKKAAAKKIPAKKAAAKKAAAKKTAAKATAAKSTTAAKASEATKAAPSKAAADKAAAAKPTASTDDK